jgi:Flp pilus assembly protein TadD
MKAVHLILLVCYLLWGLAACSKSSEEPPTGKAPPESQVTRNAEIVAANNRGVGLMGRFEYEQAAKVFAELVKNYPDLLDVKINLAIAILNRQQEGDEHKALEIADEVLRQDASHLRAHYVAGLLRLYLASPQEALGHFKRVAEADPEDPYAAYYLAQCLAQLSDHEQAYQWYRRAMDLDPYLRSAYYAAFQSLRHLKRVEEARKLIQDYQRLASNPRAHLAEFKYTRMGPKGNAQAFDLKPPRPLPSIPNGPMFTEALKLPIEGVEEIRRPPRSGEQPKSITAADLQHDGRVDLFVTGAHVSEKVQNLVLINQGNGTFRADTAHPLAGVTHVNAALWGDFDNDGLNDVYLVRRGPNQLWRQTQNAVWQDVTATTQTSAGQFNTVDGGFFDADHDGDLDLFLVNSDGPNELLNNNLDGMFRPLATERGLAGTAERSRTLVPVDIDTDRDVDILVIHDDPPHDIYLNDRLWSYRVAEGWKNFRSTPALAVIAGDLDADGRPELYSVTPRGVILRWRMSEGDGAQAERLGRVDLQRRGWAQLAVADVNGDGVMELLVMTVGGWQVFSQDKPIYQATIPSGGRLRAAIPVWRDPVSGYAIVGVAENNDLFMWSPGPGRYPFLSLSFTGKEDRGQSMRSNASGIGTQVAIRTGSRWTTAQLFRNHSGPGQSLQPLAVGLGGASQADFVAIDWSDGVFQSELALAAGQRHEIAETQRQLSSCPVLFAWDGEKYTFVSDFLGVGGLGYLTAPGRYAPPRSWENFLLPPGLPSPNRGRLQLKVAEPMEEVAYLDQVRLVAYDLSPGWQMVLDERMGIHGPEPSGEARFYRHEKLPIRAMNERLEDVTESVLAADGKAAPVGELDRRFIGRLKGEHVLTLVFPEPLDSHRGEWLLVADGWVEYPYSQTMFAAWQAEARFDPPTLEAQAGDGAWRVVLKQFGYPAGMPRRMSVPLKGLPPGTSKLRLRTNMEVYWDRLAIAYSEALTSARRYALPLQHAYQAKTGFAQRSTGSQRRPDYDYARRKPFWDTRYLKGYYTRLGAVETLVNTKDDAVAIIGPGEEIHLEFAAPQDALPEGWTRHYVLETQGWAKDMDLFTQDGETVGPLPTTGQGSLSRDRLHARYNTRFQDGR